MSFLFAWPALLIAIASLMLIVALLWAHLRRRKPGATDPKKTVEWPADLPPLEQYAKQIRDKTARRITAFVPDRTLSPSHTDTWIGKVVACAPGESWPELDGRPMIGVSQFDLTTAPYVPDGLREFALVAFFLAQDKRRDEYAIPEGDSNFLVRAYRHGQELAQYSNPPKGHLGWKPCGARAELMTDYATHFEEIFKDCDARALPIEWAQMVEEHIDEVLIPREEQENSFDPERTYGTKLGGWPAPIQDPIMRVLEFQIGSETATNMHWVDAGCIYVWRSADGWEAEMQFY
jgi:hypothetical protein